MQIQRSHFIATLHVPYLDGTNLPNLTPSETRSVRMQYMAYTRSTVFFPLYFTSSSIQHVRAMLGSGPCARYLYPQEYEPALSLCLTASGEASEV